MQSRHKAVVFTRVFVATSTLLLPSTVTADADERTVTIMSCHEADVWIENNRDALPTLYDDFVAYPLALRRRMLPHLTPGTQADLWRTHLSRAMETETGLDDDQRAMLRTVIDALDAAAFVKKELPIPLETIASVFSDDLLRRLFYQLGPNDRPAGAEQPSSQYVNICTCDSRWWFRNPCGPTEECTTVPLDECVYQPTGCGWLGWWACDGMCCDYQGAYCR